MARRKKVVTIPGVRGEELHTRDNGKTFVLTEMPAEQAEWWATRAFLALTNAGAHVPEGAKAAGMAGFAMMGIESLYQLRAEVLKPLMDEMFECIKYEHAPGLPLQAIMPGEASQIEEVATRLQLRMALVELHTGFFDLGQKLTSASDRSPAAAST